MSTIALSGFEGLANWISDRRLLFRELLDSSYGDGTDGVDAENPYDESYLRAQDRELWFRTHAYSRFECIREPLLFYREVGAFSWQKYRLSMKMDRKILLQHGPKYLGWPKTVIKLLETWVKLATYTLLDIAGSTDLMLSRRSSSLTIDEQERANQLCRE